MGNKPTLVFIASRFPYPLEKGDKLRSYNLIQGLAEQYSILLIIVSNEPVLDPWKKKLAPLVSEIHIFRLNRTLMVMRLLMNLFFNAPFQVAYFTERRIVKKIQHLLRQTKPDHIFCQMLRPAEYVKNYHSCYKTLDYMDALSVGMQRRSKTNGFFLRKLYRMEAERLKDYEQRIAHYFEFHTMISEQDAQFLKSSKDQKIHIIPNGIDTEYFAPLEHVPKVYDLVFVGNLSYPPNIHAMQWFCERVLPLNPSINLLIAGANPSVKLQSIEKNNTQVTVKGWQDDIRKVYASGRIFIAPMQIGTGLQNKLLEAMAMEIPCISTSLAASALPGNPFIVADEPKDMLNAIMNLLKDQQESLNRGKKGRKFVLEHYSWKTHVASLTELIRPS